MGHDPIEALNLGYVYPEGVVGFKDISFRIAQGESVAFVGENGSGKSTLLLHLTGCLLPSQGTLKIGSVAVTSHDLNVIRRSVGMVFQNSDDQLFMPTVFEDVAFGLHHLGWEKEQIERSVLYALECVGALHLRQRSSYKLSRGEKRAVAIATVLVMSPDILVMDEPTSDLDPLSRSHLIALLKSLKQTKVIATHDLDFAVDVCERMVVLHQGTIVQDGPTVHIVQDEELLKRSRLEKPLRMQRNPLEGRSF